MMTACHAQRSDPEAITGIYNQGIEGRDETAPRTRTQIEAWFDEISLVVVAGDAIP
jgi:L-amino acid N-acyltransferase YncA